jgi:hypothetical protein
MIQLLSFDIGIKNMAYCYCLIGDNDNDNDNDNQTKINWSILSINSSAISLLFRNKDKIDYEMLSKNPSIFTYDYEKMKNSNTNLKEEIIAAALNPKRIFRMIAEYGEDEIYNCYLDDE